MQNNSASAPKTKPTKSSQLHCMFPIAVVARQPDLTRLQTPNVSESDIRTSAKTNRRSFKTTVVYRGDGSTRSPWSLLLQNISTSNTGIVRDVVYSSSGQMLPINPLHPAQPFSQHASGRFTMNLMLKTFVEPDDQTVATWMGAFLTHIADSLERSLGSHVTAPTDMLNFIRVYPSHDTQVKVSTNSPLPLAAIKPGDLLPTNSLGGFLCKVIVLELDHLDVYEGPAGWTFRPHWHVRYMTVEPAQQISLTPSDESRTLMQMADLMVGQMDQPQTPPHNNGGPRELPPAPKKKRVRPPAEDRPRVIRQRVDDGPPFTQEMEDVVSSSQPLSPE